MKIYKVVFDDIRENAQYDSFIVRAKSRRDAINVIEEIYPREEKRFNLIPWISKYKVVDITENKKRGIILGNYNTD